MLVSKNITIDDLIYNKAKAKMILEYGNLTIGFNQLLKNYVLQENE